MQQFPQVMTVDELSRYIRLKKSTIQAKVRRGEIPHARIGKLSVFLRNVIDLWLLFMTEGHGMDQIRARILGRGKWPALGSPEFPLSRRERELLAASEQDVREGQVLPFSET